MALEKRGRAFDERVVVPKFDPSSVQEEDFFSDRDPLVPMDVEEVTPTTGDPEPYRRQVTPEYDQSVKAWQKEREGLTFDANAVLVPRVNGKGQKALQTEQAIKVDFAAMEAETRRKAAALERGVFEFSTQRKGTLADKTASIFRDGFRPEECATYIGVNDVRVPGQEPSPADAELVRTIVLPLGDGEGSTMTISLFSEIKPGQSNTGKVEVVTSLSGVLIEAIGDATYKKGNKVKQGRIMAAAFTHLDAIERKVRQELGWELRLTEQLVDRFGLK